MFQIVKSASGFSLTMSATLANIDEADQALVAFLDEVSVPVDRFTVRILLREALLNGVTHGSNTDPSRLVLMDVSIDERGLTLTVEDSGPGFIWQNREATFDIVGDGGRGLALMRIYSTHMEFNDKGNRVTLRKDFAPAAATPQTSVAE